MGVTRNPYIFIGEQMAADEAPPYGEKYEELFQIWQDQEKYIDKKCLEIEYQDKYVCLCSSVTHSR